MLKSAKEMKEKTLLNKKSYLNEELERIQILINSSVDKGYLSCSVKSLSIEARNTLSDLGYTVNNRKCGINEYETVIGWH